MAVRSSFSLSIAPRFRASRSPSSQIGSSQFASFCESRLGWIRVGLAAASFILRFRMLRSLLLLVRWPVLRRPPNTDLDLTGPDRGCPAEFEQDVSGADPAPMDLSVSPAPRAQDVLAPAAGPASTEQGSFRRELFPAVQSAFFASATPGAVRTYEAAVRVIVSKVTAILGAQVLPMATENGGVAAAQDYLVGFSPARCALEL